MTPIKFGTSGWRGIFAEEFTLPKVRALIQAIADHLHAEGIAAQGVVVGYDARFMGRELAVEAAQILAAGDIKVFLCQRDTPTPVIAHELLRRGAAGAINVTASHNPYNYNGIKFSAASGGMALPETTDDIELRANAILRQQGWHQMGIAVAREQGLVEDIDPRAAYFAALSKLVDLKAIANAGLRVAINPLYGAGRGYLDQLLEDAGVAIRSMNTHLDPYFGGHPPEPAEMYMADFISLIRDDDDISLGLATDGDADRFGIVDSDGTFITANYILPLLFDYLIRRRGLKGDAARGLSTSQLIDSVAKYHGYKVLETPVGFKYIADYITQGRILIGGEESAGLSIRGHVPEKDGILACLLVAEMVAVEGRSLQELLKDLYQRVGELYSRRINLSLSVEVEAQFDEKLANPPSHLAGQEIINASDGKFLFANGSWILFRRSGTEPVVRLCAEASTLENLDALVLAGQQFLQT